ncbi:MAG: redoxin domain-containing protein [Muribaculaceae bacterium]|nr:redoxin domain-containing protein [Muribaculaceae bacterium]
MNFKLKTTGILAGAGLLGLMVLTSAVSTKNVPLEVGNQAPEISILNTDGESVLLSELKGQEVILNFWSAMDAESRINNIRLSREAELTGAKYIGMCIDSDRELAEEVMNVDRVATDHLYFADKQVTDEYQLAKGTRIVKIDAYGTVAAID